MLVFEQNANRGRGGVVELSGLHRPHEGGEKSAGHDGAGRDEQDDDAHAGSPDLRLRGSRRRIRPTLSPTIVSELAGIRIAVASGVSRPDSASPRPITL